MTKDEEAATRYFEGHSFLGDIVQGPEELNIPAGAQVIMPGEEYTKQICIAFLAGIKDRDDNPAWVSVKERLPERDELRGEQTFFTYDNRVGTFDIEFYDVGWEFDEGSFLINVTHWIELAPPKKKGG
jgi:hypothetical protein